MKLKPLTTLPKRATLLNNGKPVAFANDLVPSDHVEQIGYLRLHGLPVNEFANTVLVVKLEFDEFPQLQAEKSVEKSDVRVR